MKSLFTCDCREVMKKIGQEGLIRHLKEMLLIRHLEIRGEAAYQQGKVGGFYHSYIGQEAIQTGCVAAAGRTHWYTTTYRCHALALLLGVTPNAIMAELYGKITGVVRGRGGSMHMCADHMLGGFGIVGGHIPIATGAAFSIKYLGQNDRVSFCFLGDGAVAQGAFHESLNLAALWSLPCIYVIENNRWGMGTAVERAIAVAPIAEHMANSYGIKAYTIDGMDFLTCHALFEQVTEETLRSSKPVLIEALTERFRGHSISDPGLYRAKSDLQKAMERDPILLYKKVLMQNNLLDEKEYEKIDKEQQEAIIAAMRFADSSPWPDPVTLEEGVLTP
jgi:pyruvate dehydrogenase E1 component alpha subunit